MTELRISRWPPPGLSGRAQNPMTSVLCFVLFCWPHHVARGILVPRPGIEPTPSAVKARSPNHWISGEVPMTSVLIRNRRGEDTGREGKAIWPERQRLECYGHKPRQTRGRWQPPEAGEGGKESPLGCLQGAQPCRYLDFRQLASRAVRENFLFL